MKTILYYIAGTLCWLVLISALKASCTLNIPYYIDSLWMSEVKENLKRNLLGTIAFHTADSQCEKKFIYTAPYYPDGMTGEFQNKTLNDLIDIDTWEKFSSDTTSTTYTDKRYRYVIYNNSDGVFMRVFNK